MTTETYADLVKKIAEDDAAHQKHLSKLRERAAKLKADGLPTAAALYKAFLAKQKEDHDAHVATSGYTVDELVGKKARASSGSAPSGRPTVYRYTDPQNPLNLYAGGKPPTWTANRKDVQTNGKLDVSKLTPIDKAEIEKMQAVRDAWDKANNYQPASAKKAAGTSDRGLV